MLMYDLVINQQLVIMLFLEMILGVLQQQFQFLYEIMYDLK